MQEICCYYIMIYQVQKHYVCTKNMFQNQLLEKIEHLHVIFLVASLIAGSSVHQNPLSGLPVHTPSLHSVMEISIWNIMKINEFVWKKLLV